MEMKKSKLEEGNTALIATPDGVILVRDVELAERQEDYCN